MALLDTLGEKRLEILEIAAMGLLMCGCLARWCEEKKRLVARIKDRKTPWHVKI